LSANQFMEVWTNYDKDSEWIQALSPYCLICTYLSEYKAISEDQPFFLFLFFSVAQNIERRKRRRVGKHEWHVLCIRPYLNIDGTVITS
jgi:hypothetical protein